MTLFETDDTLTVGQLTRQLAETVKRSFRAEVWVQGQIRNLSRSARGHVYFDLIEPVPAGAAPKASISVTLFESTRQIVNRTIKRTGNSMRMDDGVEVRIRGSVELYMPRGQLQLNMTAIDPEFTLGRLGADREQLLQRLKAEGLLDANQQIELPLVPLRVGLITAAGSAAQADFVQQLATSGYAFEVTTLAARVQGEFAPEEIAAAIQAAQGAAAPGGPFDVVAVVRGGGARTDLAAFDTEPVARAIATCTLPVLVGIGHEIDQSVADLVAHAAFKTPTACAQQLVERVVGFDFALAERAERLRRLAAVSPLLHLARIDAAAQEVVERTQALLATAQQRNGLAAAGLERRVGRRINRTNDRLAEVSTRVRIGAAAALTKAERRCTRAGEDLSAMAPRHLRAASQRIDLLEARLSAVDPAQALRRGWSITTTSDGRLVRSIDDVETDVDLITRVADGTVHSTVTQRRAAAPSTTAATTGTAEDQDLP